MHIRKSLLAGLLAATLLAGCSSNSDSAPATTTTTTTLSSSDSHITVAPYRWVEGWDPHQDWNGVNVTRFLVCEGLITLNDKFELEGVLATSWVQEDDVTYRFAIRPDVYFFNGNL